MLPWKLSGARSNVRLWSRALPGPRTKFGVNSSSISRAPTTGAGSTALWVINHLWTSNKTTTKMHRTDSCTVTIKRGEAKGSDFDRGAGGYRRLLESVRGVHRRLSETRNFFVSLT